MPCRNIAIQKTHSRDSSAVRKFSSVKLYRLLTSAVIFSWSFSKPSQFGYAFPTFFTVKIFEPSPKYFGKDSKTVRLNFKACFSQEFSGGRKKNSDLDHISIDLFDFRKLQFSIAISVNFPEIISEKFEWCDFGEFHPIFDFSTTWQKSGSYISTQTL